MRYQYAPGKLSHKSWRDYQNREWKIITPSMFLEYSKKNQIILAGDIRQKGKVPGNSSVTDGEKQLHVLGLHQKKGALDKVEGYMRVEDEQGAEAFLRIMGTSTVKWLLPLCILIALVAGGIIAWLCLANQGPTLDSAAIAYKLADGSKNTDPNQISLPGVDTVRVDSRTMKGKTALINIEGNPCYLRYTITMEDTGREIYRSGLIEPGTALLNYNVNEVNDGEYSVMVLVESFSLEDETVEFNSGSIKAVLKVGEYDE